ncbi:OsmC family protein [Tianweitania populi]|uniref:Oxidoreductase n=1 Tax=Tianweitania populi TaxID=1607949 RepID=A0A8J3DQU1_9HYPH|nr:OsmC family protein [Tianweitania populi]GHD17842.1 oxidoreductase [Tianweitania populi]
MEASSSTARTATVELRNIEGTQAALGWAGGHTLVVDRPDGMAGGMGLGFNGAQMLALSLGGCFCNDLRYTAEKMGVQLGPVAVTVTLTLDGDPLLAQSAAMQVDCTLIDGSDAGAVIEAAKASCMVSNSLRKGFPVSISEAARA